MALNLDPNLANELSDEDICSLASFAELANNYEHVYELISIVLERKYRSDQPLNFMERTLFGNCVIKLITDKIKKLNTTIHAALTHGGKKLLEKSGYELILRLDIETSCNQIVDKINPFIMDNDIENDVFLLKIIGELYRYLYEIIPEKTVYSDYAKTSYLSALEKSKQLDILNPIRLGLIMNYTTFIYEWEEKKEQAIEIASKTYEEANQNIKNIKDEWKNKTTNVLELIKNNIISWTNKSKEQIKNITNNVANNVNQITQDIKYSLINNNNNNNNDGAISPDENLIATSQIDPAIITTSVNVNENEDERKENQTLLS